MIALSSILTQVLRAPTIESFLLVTIGSLHKTTFYRDVLYDGVTYLADGTLESVEPPRITSTVDKAAFRVTLNDPDIALGGVTFLDSQGVSRNLLGAVGHPLSVRMAFVDQVTRQPILTPADTFVVYAGRIDSTGFNIDTETAGNSLFVISGTSPMGDLDLTKAFYTSQDFLDKNYPGDTSYEQLYEGSGPVNLRWGKK